MPRKPNTTGEHYNDPFPTILRELIKDNNTTQEELTAVLNVKTRQSVTGYIDGSTLPTIDKVVALADFFNVSVDYLLGRTGPKTTDPDLRFVCEYTGLSEKAINNINKLSPRYTELLSDLIASASFEAFLTYFIRARDFTGEVKNNSGFKSVLLDYEQDLSLESVMMLARYHAFEGTQAALQLLNEICDYEEITETAMSTLLNSRRQHREERGDNGEYQED